VLHTCGLAGFADGFIHLVLLDPDGGAALVGRRIFGVEVAGLAEIGDGLVQHAPLVTAEKIT
jgi:hypothetical protein